MRLNEFLDHLGNELSEAAAIASGKKLSGEFLEKVKELLGGALGANFKDLKTDYTVAYWYEPGDDEVPVVAEPLNYRKGKFPDMWADIETDIDDDNELRGTWFEISLDGKGNPEDIEFVYDDSTE